MKIISVSLKTELILISIRFIYIFDMFFFPTGVCHADELQYLFPLGKSLFVSAAPTKQDEKIRQALLELWVNFANTG